jgi:[acyl-carrier-protein] S-malonyltransferase
VVSLLISSLGLAQLMKAKIKENLIAQLTAPVKWTQTVQNMLADGATHFTEIGPGKVLTGLIKKIDRNAECENIGSL